MALPPLAIHMFGPLRVTVRGAPLPRVRTRSVEWLLALLTLRHGRAVSRAWLAGTLWPESTGSQALKNLRNDLVALRQALGPEGGRLQSPARDSLTLDLTGAAVDLAQFDAAILAGDEESLRRAVAVYTGPLLEGCLEEWAFTERAARAEQLLAALETLAERAEARSEHEEAIRHLRRAEALDPLRDSLPRRLMASLAAAGDPAAAIQTYRDFRLRLQEELAATPDEETTRLFHEIRAAARTTHSVGTRLPTGGRRLGPPPAPDPAVTDTGSRRAHPPGTREPLPCPLTSLIGREQDVEEILAALQQARLLTLVGGGGVGKTRLAVEVARRASDKFPSGAAWVELGSLAESTLLLPTVAAAVGIREAGGSPGAEALMRQLVAGLAEDAPLLVLDNCEHLLDAAAAVVRLLLDGCPELRVLATSRQRLGLSGEQVWRVPSLALPPAEGIGSGVSGIGGGGSGPGTPRPLRGHPPTPDALLQYAAVRLFVERAGSARPGFRLASDAEAAAVGQICRRLDGIPLAIELAAARTRVLTPQQIAARLDDRFRLLTQGERGTLSRHQTLRALIDWSYDSLPPAEAALLRRLSVFTGGWTLEAAEAVCSGVQVFGCSGGWDLSDPTDPSDPERLDARTPECLNAIEVLDALDGLEDRSLVLVDEVAEGLRYRMLETVREYSRERLVESGEADAIRRRHAAFFLALAERGASGIIEPEQMDRLEREHDNLGAALAWCKEAVGSRQCGYPRSGWMDSTDQSGKTGPPLSELTTDHPPASRVPAPPTAVEMGLRLGGALVQFWITRGYWTEGREQLAELLALPQATARTAARGRALNVAGNLAWNQGDRRAARELYQEGLAIFRALDDKTGIAVSLWGLGVAVDARLDYGAARALLEESLVIFRELGDEGAIAGLLWALAGMTRDQGDHEAARALLEEGLAIQRERGDTTGMASTLSSLGVLVRDQGEYGAARELFEESLAIFRELGNRHAMVYTFTNLARVALAQGDSETARARLEEGEALVPEIQDRRARIHPLGALGHLARDLGDHRRAAALYHESLLLRRELGDQFSLAQSLEDFACLAGSQQLWKRAATLLGAAEAVCADLAATPPVSVADDYRRTVSIARAALGEAAFAAGWAEGRAMSLDQAILHALGDE